MTDLNNLAERCEAATGPDRELDKDIGRYLASVGTFSCWGCDDPLRFTASLDAAITLVPEDAECGPMPWYLNTNTFVGAEAEIFTADTDGPPQVRAEAATPALALAAAALKSRAMQEGSSNV